MCARERERESVCDGENERNYLQLGFASPKHPSRVDVDEAVALKDCAEKLNSKKILRRFSILKKKR